MREKERSSGFEEVRVLRGEASEEEREKSGLRHWRESERERETSVVRF